MNTRNPAAERPSAVPARRDAGDAPRALTVTPAVDVYEDKHGVTLWADLPGVSKERLEVKIQDGHLSIDAHAVLPMPASLRAQHVEVREPHFARTFQLSPDFDTTKIEANLQDGVLKLTIPRRDEARPRRIDVQ
ncbi:Hsp20/alpha crystallin family protein [Burkholderia pseudomallei]|uniref:Heat shock protein n=6 Tax=Burkholderia pseudomallei TaxID=28450 RepID=Q63VC0_BURPS|nr:MULTISPECIES: Hsp20/alpha crystallin family protein [Burkholderia]EIF64128.1 heat shock protein [Burkholderia pseudomallei 1258a]MCE2031855.1 Hsp20/alpha crystallin family protein [Burkholderia pseudomallei CS]MCE2038104.1 Hsp20/alpha crystallin family protein [Burkholderia pseudomallei CB]MCE2043989.1 Hsp20/alpha crystallin family protein [Burkholderia pseudomallei OS]MCE2050114.1 Hsp20/alpha crystallin family protein [Burkholderia pseudomallei OB]